MARVAKEKREPETVAKEKREPEIVAKGKHGPEKVAKGKRCGKGEGGSKSVEEKGATIAGRTSAEEMTEETNEGTNVGMEKELTAGKEMVGTSGTHMEMVDTSGGGSLRA